MSTFVAATLVFLLATLGMAVGVIFGRRRLAGSCGGRAGGLGCDACDTPSEDCKLRR